MKRTSLIIAWLFIIIAVHAQPGSKPAQKEKAPTQKEMEEMIKEFEKMSPEERKMMEQMGIKMPDIKKMQKEMSGVSDKQLADAWEDETRLVPMKDAARIAGIPATPLTAAALPAYLSATHNKVATRLTASAKSKGEEIYKAIRTQYKNYAGNIAAGLWMAGRMQLALYVMGKVCSDNTTDADNISNYAAMLSMCGAEQLAIPLLNHLNKRFPGNSTLLNNLGQAWFGLGEINKAEKYLDSTIRIYAYHPQANFTKSFIEESKDRTPQAIEAVKKSIHDYYSEEKDSRLRKLGYQLNGDDISFPFKPEADPLGMNGFSHPAFPVNAEQEVGLKKEWAEFRNQLDQRMTQLNIQMKAAEQAWAKKMQEMINYNMQVVRTSMAAGRPTGNLTPVPLFSRKAAVKLKAMEKDGGAKYRLEKALKELALYPSQLNTLKQQYEKDMAKIAEEDLEQTGEGLPNKDFCPRYAQRVSQYLLACNPEYEKRSDEYLQQHRLFYSEQLFWMQYAQWPEEFEITKLGYQIAWLRILRDLKYTETGFFDNRPLCIKKDENRKPKSKLSNFDDVACKYHSEMNLVVFTMESNCSRMETKLNTPFLKLGLKQDMDKETFGDQFVSCSVEIKARLGVKVGEGPATVGARLEGGAGIEIGRDGVNDAWLVGGAAVGLKGPLKAGVEGKVSLISGKTSLEGRGILSILNSK